MCGSRDPSIATVAQAQSKKEIREQYFAHKKITQPAAISIAVNENAERQASNGKSASEFQPAETTEATLRTQCPLFAPKADMLQVREFGVRRTSFVENSSSRHRNRHPPCNQY
jgi:hypothetical protein